MKNNKKAFSLIISMFLVFVSTLLALFLLEYIIPFLRNTKGMENGVKAYYQAYSGIEDALFVKKGKDSYFENTRQFGSSPIDYKYVIKSTGRKIPLSGEGTSDYDSNYNTISTRNPVQLLLKKDIGGDVEIFFKVPHFTENNTPISFSGGNTPIVNWMLSSPDDSLIASGSQVKASEINDSTGTLSKINITSQNGYKLSDLTRARESFSAFYIRKCGTSSGCSLKLSVLTKLQTSDGTEIPYLEYKIEGFNEDKVGNYYTKIDSTGKAVGYRKDLEIFIPQRTTSSSFDNSVFQ